MTFPKAYSGIKALITGQTLQVISLSLSILFWIIRSVFIYPNHVEGDINQQLDLMTSILFFGVVVLVLNLISYIINIIGLKKAASDDPVHFNMALTFNFVLLFITVTRTSITFVTGMEDFVKILDIIINVVGTWTIFYIVFSMNRFAEKLGAVNILSFGKVVLVIMSINLIIDSIEEYVRVTAIPIKIFSALVSSLIYLVYLKQCRKMLSN